jgi:hypothetical protein
VVQFEYAGGVRQFSAQGCFNPGEKKNKEGKRCPFIDPGLKQPWAEISERLRRYLN